MGSVQGEGERSSWPDSKADAELVTSQDLGVVWELDSTSGRWRGISLEAGRPEVCLPSTQGKESAAQSHAPPPRPQMRQWGPNLASHLFALVTFSSPLLGVVLRFFLSALELTGKTLEGGAVAQLEGTL